MANDIIVSSSNAPPSASEGTTGSVAQQVEVASHAQPPASRRAQIEKIMREDYELYDRTLRNEYRSLLEAEIEQANPDAGMPTRPAQPDDARTALCGSAAGQKLVLSWQKFGGFRHHLQVCQNSVGALVRSLGGVREQRVFLEKFSRAVPVEAEVAVLNEIASGKPSFVHPATKDEIASFARTPAGAELVAEWGVWAPELVGILYMRAARLDQAMDDDQAERFWTWFDRLTDAEAKVIFQHMVR